MDDENASADPPYGGNRGMVPHGAFQRMTKLEDIGHKAQGIVYVRDLTVDKYILTDEESGSSCVRFSAIAENYDRPIFYGKIYSNFYKIRWQTDCSLAEIIDEIHEYLLTMQAVETLDDEVTYTNDLNGVKIACGDCESDAIFTSTDLENNNFWQLPLAFLHNHDINSITGVYFYTPYGEVNFEIKDHSDTSQYEMCVISHCEQMKVLARLISATHRVCFDTPDGAFEFLDSALTNYQTTFITHFSQLQND